MQSFQPCTLLWETFSKLSELQYLWSSIYNIITGLQYHIFSFQVLLICFIFCTVTHAAMAILGYVLNVWFRGAVPVNSLNLPTEKLSCSRVAIYTTLVNPISKYALMVAPIVDIKEENCFPYYSMSDHDKSKLGVQFHLCSSEGAIFLGSPRSEPRLISSLKIERGPNKFKSLKLYIYMGHKH